MGANDLARKETIVNWLLASQVPSIRYLTLRELLGKAADDPEVQAAWEEIQTSGPVAEMLSHQTEAGNWEGERGYYTPKYVSTHWNMLLLVELAADGTDARFRRGVEFMLADTQAELEEYLQTGGQKYACFYGNLLRYALHGGFLADARTQNVIEYLIRDAAEYKWRCPINGDLPCAWGAARALFGLAAIPVEKRTIEIETAVQSGIQLLLEDYELLSGNYPTPEKVHSMWSKLNFPLFYQADVLFVLRVLAELGRLDHASARPALDWLQGFRRTDGTLRGSSPYRSRTWKSVAGKEDTHRWVTLHAEMILQKASQ